MNGLGDQLLAGAAFPRDEHRGIGRRDPADQLEDPQHPGIPAHQLAEVETRVELVTRELGTHLGDLFQAHAVLTRDGAAHLNAQFEDGDAEGIGARLEKWCQGGALGWVFDNEKDALSLDARFIGFDMTDFLENAEIRTPVMLYLFERIDALLTGERMVIAIDEFWKALADPAFTAFAQDGLKTYRKRNAFLVFATQSPADALRSTISHSILEQVATKIFLPNPFGQRRDYIEGFSLSEAEYSRMRGSETIGVKVELADGKEYPHEGKLNFAGSTVDAATGTVQMRAELPNPKLDLLPGQYVRVRVQSGTQQAFVVPQTAVAQNESGRFVWVIADGKAAQRQIRAGNWLGSDWVVLDGLKPGDKVITQGLANLKTGAPIKPVPASAAEKLVPRPAGSGGAGGGGAKR